MKINQLWQWGEHQICKSKCSLWSTQQECMELERHLGSNQNQVVILSTLLYGCETWTTYQHHIKKLNHFHTTYLRKIVGITWQKHIPDTGVLIQAPLPSIYIILMLSQLHLAGHVVRMKDYHLQKKLFYGELSQGKHSQGGKRKYFKDTQKVSMKSFGITPNCLEYLVWDRDKWHEVVKHLAKVCETRTNTATESCRKLRKGTATSATAATIPCSHCLRLVSLAICTLANAFLNHKVDQMVSLITKDKEKDIYKQDLALSNIQGLICHKMQPTNQPSVQFFPKDLTCICNET